MDRPTAEPIRAAVAEAPASDTAQPKAAAPRVELQDDEIIQLSIRPSLWYVPLRSAHVVTVMTLIAVAVGVASQGFVHVAGTVALVLAFLAALASVIVATLQWASQLYVLTNRRVMWFHGVPEVTVTECPLTEIEATRVHVMWFQRLYQIGSIRMTPCGGERSMLLWEHVSRPDEIHEILVRAINKAKMR